MKGKTPSDHAYLPSIVAGNLSSELLVVVEHVLTLEVPKSETVNLSYRNGLIILMFNNETIE
ncbi:hypothetical protein DPMN_028956 [Dreissena polymorpha]|uniref:Uncharacterized protein n=1 Tax=Dreissena polymorpha TaxID=45954 RepID=A0A9D4LXW1_DREPO|nr:hypothetical protein DPMN_028956 [Dreissena polymorpha]